MSIPLISTPFGVCSDCHLHNWSAFSTVQPDGTNSRLNAILAEILQAAMNAKAAGGKRLYIAGDLFHVRGSVSPTVLNPAIDLFTTLADNGIETRILTGNHDLESRDSEKLSSACETLRSVPGVKVVSEPMVYHDDKVVMIPWFDSMDRVRVEIEAVINQLHKANPGYNAIPDYSLILHAPLNGVIAGIPDHGFYAAELAKHGFKHVFCGHYHAHKRFGGNVVSVGATTHQTWNDVNTLAGHLVVDDKLVSFFESTAPKFIDYYLSWDDDTAAERCKNNFIRVRLGSATEEEIEMIRDHVLSLGALGCVVQAIPTPKSAATARTATVSAPTTRESVSDWIKANTSGGADLEKLCQSILDEVEGVTL